MAYYKVNLCHISGPQVYVRYVLGISQVYLGYISGISQVYHSCFLCIF